MKGSKPDLSHLKVWGCQCFPLIPPELRTKAGPRRFEAIFVGYEENRIGWRVRDLSGKYFFSRDVIFNESVPGHLSPRRGIPVDPSSLPPPSIIPQTIIPPSTDITIPSIKLPLTHSPSILPTPLYTPTISDTIHIRDTLLTARNNYRTRSKTNSLPTPKPHYNDINTITSFISINNNFLFDDPITTTYPTDYYDLYELCFLSAPLPFFHTRPFDLSKPPNTYNEALKRPDTST